MLDPSKRTLTILLGVAVIVLVAAILVGQRMGSRVLTQVEDNHTGGIVAVTPAPTSTAANYGPDWKRSQTLAAAIDPSFPDPRVPPVPIPTIPPTPKPTATPLRPTPNPNIPIWDQTPIPSGPVTPMPSTSPTVNPSASRSPEAPGSPAPEYTPTATPENPG